MKKVEKKLGKVLEYPFMWPRAATPPEPFRLSGLTPLQGVSRSRFSSPIPAISQRPAARDSGSVKNGTNLQIRCTPGTADLSKSAKNVLSAVPYRLSLLQSGEQVRQPLNIIALFGRLPDQGARNPEEIASFLPGCRTFGLAAGNRRARSGPLHRARRSARPVTAEPRICEAVVPSKLTEFSEKIFIFAL